VICLSAFLDACYILRQQDIDTDGLDALDTALANFWRLHDIFQTSGVWPNGFSLPRQHALFHYHRHIEDFGAPGRLCSSITESRHITAVKKPWRRSNRYQALGQMLKTNQRLEKLAAMHSDFVACGMLPAGHAPGRGVSLITRPRQAQVNDVDAQDNDEEPVEEENIEGHVSLARTFGKSISSSERTSLIFPERGYPRDMESLSIYIGEPDLIYLTQDCLATQTNTTMEDLYPLGTASVFHSAVATFFAPSDISGTCGWRRERIRSAPSWRGGAPRRDCAFIVEDEGMAGMAGMAVVRILLFFSVTYNGVQYPCALVEWFQRMGRDPITGMWVVCPDRTRGRRDKTVVHLDSFLRAAHLIPVYGKQKIPLDFDHSYSLDTFEAYYVNKYIDHHSYEVVF
jgi:hypothetical protein